MNISASAWSSGCESGWTAYLDESYLCPRNNNNGSHYHHPSYRLKSTSRKEECEEEEAEDLSMVSDASSGPPHFPEDDKECIIRGVKQKITGKERIMRSKKVSKEKKKHAIHNNNNLDDTASSPAISYNSKWHMQMYCNPSCNQASGEHFMGFSQNLSATHFEGNSAFSNQYAIWQASSHPKNALLSQVISEEGGNEQNLFTL